MKNILFFVLISTSLNVAAQIDEGLVSYYRFSNNLLDDLGNANPAQVIGTIYGADRDNVPNESIVFNGSGDFFDSQTSFDYPNRSISFWFIAENVSGTAYESHSIINMDSYELASGAIVCEINNGILNLKAANDPEYTSTPVIANKWYHLVMIREGAYTRYFLDGQNIGNGEAGTSGSTVYPYANLVIGTDRKRDRRWFDGKVDEVRIYNRALTIAEIQLLQSQPTNILGDWIFLSGNSDIDPIFHRGNVAIGEIDPGNYKLSVNGVARTKEIEVQPDGWSDHVLSDDYKLPPLDEIKAFILREGHLPNIPSEEEVLNNGVSLGKFCNLLLAKIEELTLYSIQQDRAIRELQNELQMIRSTRIKND